MYCNRPTAHALKGNQIVPAGIKLAYNYSSYVYIIIVATERSHRTVGYIHTCNYRLYQFFDHISY